MTRTIRLLILACVVAGLGVAAPVKGNETKGKYYFKKTCKDCHTKGATGGELSPLTKTMAQWDRFFAKGTHPPTKEPLTKILSAAELIDVQTFLVKHAADSLQPETCGK